MIGLNCIHNFDGKRLAGIAAKGGGEAIVRAAAYVRGVAARKVKRRKHKSSPAGQPPYAHSNVFKASILYAYDRHNAAAYVGPKWLATGRANYAGEPVPEILEFGGMAALGMNANWIHKRAPRGTNSLHGIAKYFRYLGKGPIAWGNSPGEADAKVGRGGGIVAAVGRASTKTGKMKFRVHPKRYSPMLRKKVYLAYIGINTNRQAERVAKTVVDVFGYPATNRPIKVAARPLMGPSLEESRTQIGKYFQNIMKG